MAIRPVHGIIPKDLTKTIHVIGAGFPRTGTTSFLRHSRYCLVGQYATAVLPVLCVKKLIPLAFIKKWISILPIKSGESDEFVDNTLRDILAGYTAVVDVPGAYFPGELSRAYPNAKVICTVRDPDEWWPNMLSLFNMVRQRPWNAYLFWPVPTLRYWHTMADKLATRRSIYLGPEGNDFNKELLEKHYDAVKRDVPADRLYFFDVKDGWEPLCKILDCPVPDEPLPHVHDRDEIRRAWERVERKARLVWPGIFLVSGAVLATGYAYAMRS